MHMLSRSNNNNAYVTWGLSISYVFSGTTSIKVCIFAYICSICRAQLFQLFLLRITYLLKKFFKKYIYFTSFLLVSSLFFFLLARQEREAGSENRTVVAVH